MAAGVVALSAALAAPASARAAPFTCEASALRGSALGAPALEPVTANRGHPACRTIAAKLGQPLPAALSVETAVAETSLTGPAGRVDRQAVSARGEVTDLRVRALPALPIELPPVVMPAELGAITVPIPSVPPLPPTVTLDLRPALLALVPGGRLPAVDLVRVQGATAEAAARCQDGAPVLTGTSGVTGLSVLGQELPTDQVVDQALTLVETASIDPSDVDLGLVALPPGLSFTDPAVGPVLQAVVKPALDALPSIEVPATVARVRVTPGRQIVDGGTLQQLGPRVEASVAGQTVADVVLGDARVGARDVDCAPPTTPADLALSCTKRRLVLVDVFQRRGRVKLLGAADRRFAGRTVRIVFAATGRVVARARVAADGGFETTAPLPAARIRATNRARYRAVIDRERSLNLKLARRMIVTRMTHRGGKVTIAGRVTRPLAAPRAPIVVQRRISCRRNVVVKRFRPEADGRFRVTVDAPAGRDAAVYRLATRVRKFERNRKTFPTFTLPRAVNLR